MVVGARIQQLLEQQGLSQSELARRVGLRQSTVNMLINGHTQGSKHLHKIARVLGTTPAYLNGETNDPLSDSPDLASLTAQEQRLVDIYRDLPDKDRSALKRLIESMARKSPAPD